MDKTIVVNVIRHVSHPLYQKKVKLSKRYHAHDENNQCQIGDKVQIMETRPISRHKRWRLVDITEKAK
jgi:small subunit ribosomal protein S17